VDSLIDITDITIISPVAVSEPLSTSELRGVPRNYGYPPFWGQINKLSPEEMGRNGFGLQISRLVRPMDTSADR